jgi:hypothetical protein
MLIRDYNSDFSQPTLFYNGSVNTIDNLYDPFVGGYAFIKWLKLPTWVTSRFENFEGLSERSMKEFSGLSDATISAATVQLGFSPTEVSYAAGISMDAGFSLTHQEFSGTPLSSAYSFWVGGIRDPITNVSDYWQYANVNAKEYGAQYHSGVLLYVVTRPDARNNVSENVVEFASLYTNVIPTKLPMEHFNYSGGSNDTKTYTQEFFGKRHIGKKVMELGRQVHKTMITDKSTGHIIITSDGNATNDTGGNANEDLIV